MEKIEEALHHLDVWQEYFRKYPPVFGIYKRVWDNYYKYYRKEGNYIYPESTCVKCGHKIGSHGLEDGLNCGLINVEIYKEQVEMTQLANKKQ